MSLYNKNLWYVVQFDDGRIVVAKPMIDLDGEHEGWLSQDDVAYPHYDDYEVIELPQSMQG